MLTGIEREERAKFADNATLCVHCGPSKILVSSESHIGRHAAPRVQKRVRSAEHVGRGVLLDTRDDRGRAYRHEGQTTLFRGIRIVGDVGARCSHDRWEHVLRMVVTHESGKIFGVRIVATAVFERIVYQCVCTDPADPAHPVLEVDAILRDGDADGPLLLPVASYKAMIGFDAAAACIPAFRRAARTEQHDGVEYLTFPLWRRVG